MLPKAINQAEAQNTNFNNNYQNQQGVQSQKQSTVNTQQVNQTSQVAYKPEVSNCLPMKQTYF